MRDRLLFLFVGVVIGFAGGAFVAPPVSLKPSHVVWCLCLISVLLGIGAGFRALLPPHADNPPSSPAGLIMWIAVSALALSGILATVATKFQQAGY